MQGFSRADHAMVMEALTEQRFSHPTHGPRRTTVALFVKELFGVQVQNECSSLGGREHQVLFFASVVSPLLHLVPSVAGYAMYAC